MALRVRLWFLSFIWTVVPSSLSFCIYQCLPHFPPIWVCPNIFDKSMPVAACCDDEINEQRILRAPAIITLSDHAAVCNARCGRLQGGVSQRFSTSAPPVVRSHLPGGPQARPNIYLILRKICKKKNV